MKAAPPKDHIDGCLRFRVQEMNRDPASVERVYEVTCVVASIGSLA
jgi:hypothetical protein